MTAVVRLAGLETGFSSNPSLTSVAIRAPMRAERVVARRDRRPTAVRVHSTPQPDAARIAQ